MLRGAPLLLPSLVAAADPVVTIPGVGTVSGVEKDGEVVFKGIPYAAPPVDDLRWMPPAAAAGWNGTRAAKNFGAACMGAGAGCTPTSEDCLFLNVHAPAAPPSSPIPVMVWFHGGGYSSGCSNVYHLNAQYTSSAVVWVSVNYRLNVFGFAGSPDLATAGGGTGNYGLQDQRAALAWVRDHIAAFGGDKDSVMIYGESAGGNSIVNHLAQTASWPLYHKAIIESGTYHGATSLDSAAAQFAGVLDKLSCSKDRSGVACARSAAAADVEAAGGHFGPTVDGVSLTAEPWQLIQQGKHNTKVPVVLGSNRDEAALFMMTGNRKMTESDFDAAAEKAAPGKGAQVKQLYSFNGSYPYPAAFGSYSQWWWAAMRVSTDSDRSLGACSVRKTARALAAAGNPGVWTYLFAHPPALPLGVKTYTVPHACEISFGMGNHLTNGAGELDLSNAMSGYWVRFAVTGDPNADGKVEWPQYAAAGDKLLRFDVAAPNGGGIAVQTGLRKEACDFWDSVQ